MYISFQDSALKDLRKVDKHETKKILQTIDNLKNYPNVPNIKKLVNHYPLIGLELGIIEFYLI